MKKIKETLLIVLMSGTGLTVSHAQKTVSATGAEATGSNGSVSYTVGQIDYITNTGSNTIINEGVQQPWDTIVIARTPGINLLFSVYPNPTTDFVTLKIDGYPMSNLTYHIYDNNGKLIRQHPVETAETKILMKNLMDATYYLKVFDGKTIVSVYKLTLNN